MAQVEQWQPFMGRASLLPVCCKSHLLAANNTAMEVIEEWSLDSAASESRAGAGRSAKAR